MEEQINEQNLIAQLRAAFPELEGRFQDEVAFFGGNGRPAIMTFSASFSSRSSYTSSKKEK